MFPTDNAYFNLVWGSVRERERQSEHFERLRAHLRDFEAHREACADCPRGAMTAETVRQLCATGAALFDTAFNA